MASGFIPLFKVQTKNAAQSVKRFLSFRFAKRGADTDDALNKGGQGKKAAVAAAATLGVLVLIGYLCMSIAMTTRAAVKADLTEEYLSSIFLSIQIAVLMLGGMILIGGLYYGKDNRLLLSLPVSSRTVFSVKLLSAYLSVALIGEFLTLPTLLSFGITCTRMGVHIGAGFYIISIFSGLLLPMLPLFLLSLLAMPLMYLGSLFKSRTAAKILAVAVVAVVMLTLYIGVMLGSSVMLASGAEGEAVMREGAGRIIASVGRVGVVNLFLTHSLLGKNAAASFFIYIAIIVAAATLTVFLSGVFYNKGLALVIEEAKARTKRKVREGGADAFISRGFSKSFLRKEIKTLTSTPALLLNGILGIIVIPLLVVFLGYIGGGSLSDTVTVNGDLHVIGMTVYIASLMTVSTNTIALAGYSIEGKNICVLKSMPVSSAEILRGKIVTANIYNAVISVETFITYVAASKTHNVLIGFLVMLCVFSLGLGGSGLGIFYDLQNPNFNYKSINELTRNNRKVIKPVLTVVCIGLIPLILGVVLSMTNINHFTALLSFFLACLAVNGAFAFLSLKKLFDNADEFYDRIEV